MKKILYRTLALTASATILFALTGCKPKENDFDETTDIVETLPEEDETEPPEEEPEGEAPPEEEEEQEEEEEEEKETYAFYLLINTDGLNVRSGAGTGYSVVGQVSENRLIGYYGQKGDWYETRYRGKIAYVSKSYVTVFTMQKASDEIETVIEEGVKYLGTPYVYGATRLHNGYGTMLSGFTTNAFDCSSYMQYIFYEGADKILQTTTRTQVFQGTEVKKSEIERGDLLFMTNASRYYNTGVERIGHVALYLGNNLILHTASDYANIEEISPTRWKYYITARRML